MSDIDLQDQAIQIDTEKGTLGIGNYESDAGIGLTEDTVKYISDVKDDPNWVREFRLNALEVFKKEAHADQVGGQDLENIDFDKIRYYLSKGQQPARRLGRRT